MSELTEKKCVPCEGGVDPLDRAQATQMMGQIGSGWTLNEAATELRQTFKFKDFYETMAFVNAVAWIANQEDHHPDMEVGWGRCGVRFTTHAIDGLSENDFICAAKIDALLALEAG
jgi:4a-hydroxytetrahydrobiopterin dehydratase